MDKKEMPGYQKLGDEYGSHGFVVGFKFDNMPDVEDAGEFAKRIGVHYPLAVATDELKRKFGGIEGVAHNDAIRSRWRVAYEGHWV